MMSIWVFREKLRSFYGKYEVFITPALRFLLGFYTFRLLNSQLGFYARLDSVWVELVLALVCSVLPYGVMAFAAGILLLIHTGAVSLEMTLILLVLMVFLLILYYSFQPGDSYLLLLAPIFFHWKIPYALPILAGLSGGLASVVPVCCGTALYYILQYIRQNAGVLSGEASLGFIEQYTQILKTIMTNRTMLVFLIACAAGFLAVYLIRRLPVNYSWVIAIVAGALVQLASVFVGDFLFDVTVPVGELLAGLVLSVLLAAVYHFFVFAVDYTRTEYVQFEDDDYYYYVKAVPKISVSLPDVKVQKIGRKRYRDEGPED